MAKDDQLWDIRIGLTENPAIGCHMANLADYLLDQAGYYRSLDDAFCDEVAELLVREARRIETDRKQRMTASN